MENIVNKNKVLEEYFAMFDKSEWDEVGEKLMEYAIKCITEGNENENYNNNDNVETVQSNNNKQKFTVKKESKAGNQSGNNMKRKVSGNGNNNCKLFTVSINQIVNESENKKNNSLFTLDNKLSSLSRQLQSVNNYPKHHKFNVEHTKY